MIEPARHPSREQWEEYLGERTGTYAYRCRRYYAVNKKLKELGFVDGDLIYDVGAGMCEFGRYLFREADWTGRYVPVDGAIDGTELNDWAPPVTAHAFVAIEVIEHLRDPGRMLALMQVQATRGVVVTTPNPETVDVLALDRTHVHPIPVWFLRHFGFEVETVSLFGKPDDTLIGTWNARG